MIGDPIPPTNDMMYKALSETSRLGVKLPYQHLYDILSAALKAEDITVIAHHPDDCPSGQCSIVHAAKRRQSIG